MKIAIFYENNRLSYPTRKKMKISIFDIQNEIVNGVENITIEPGTMDQLLVALKEKNIDEVYISEIDDESRNKLTTEGIKVKTADMLRNDKLFNSLYTLP